MLWTMQDIPVREVNAYSNHLAGSPLPSHDCYLVAMHFADGAIGKLFVTSGCNGAEFGRFLEVYGSDGTLREGKLFRRDQEPVGLEDLVRRGSAGGHGWPGAIADFLDVLTEGKPNPVPSLMGARNVAVCEAALRSARGGGPQPVEWFA
jgi:predicted dehydrogenase